MRTFLVKFSDAIAMEDTQMGNQEQEEINSLKILIWRMYRQVSPIKSTTEEEKFVGLSLLLSLSMFVIKSSRVFLTI